MGSEICVYWDAKKLSIYLQRNWRSLRATQDRRHFYRKIVSYHLKLIGENLPKLVYQINLNVWFSCVFVLQTKIWIYSRSRAAAARVKKTSYSVHLYRPNVNVYLTMFSRHVLASAGSARFSWFVNTPDTSFGLSVLARYE